MIGIKEIYKDAKNYMEDEGKFSELNLLVTCLYFAEVISKNEYYDIIGG